MQFRIAATSCVTRIDTVTDRLTNLDPTALVDVDSEGRLRISTLLPDAEVLLALGLAGLFIAPHDMQRMPSDCCGGCGG